MDDMGEIPVKAVLVFLLLIPAVVGGQQTVSLRGPVSLEIRSADTMRVLRVSVDVQRRLFGSLGVLKPAPGEVRCGPTGCVATTPAILELAAGPGDGHLSVADSDSELEITIVAANTRGRRAVARGRRLSFTRDASGELRIGAPRAGFSVSALPQTSRGVCPWPGPASFLRDRPSPPDSAIIPLGTATAVLCYSQPSARGRRVFGGMVEYGKVWRTGANEPTMLFLPTRAVVAGVPLAPGRYILLSVPNPDRWTLIISTTNVTEPARMFAALTEVARAELIPDATTAFVEQLRIRSEPADSGSRLVLEWENTRLRIPITAAPDRLSSNSTGRSIQGRPSCNVGSSDC